MEHEDNARHRLKSFTELLMVRQRSYSNTKAAQERAPSNARAERNVKLTRLTLGIHSPRPVLRGRQWQATAGISRRRPVIAAPSHRSIRGGEMHIMGKLP